MGAKEPPPQADFLVPPFLSQVGGHYVHSRRGNGNGNAGGPVGRDGRGLSAIVGSVVDRLNIAHALEDK